MYFLGTDGFTEIKQMLQSPTNTDRERITLFKIFSSESLSPKKASNKNAQMYKKVLLMFFCIKGLTSVNHSKRQHIVQHN